MELKLHPLLFGLTILWLNSVNGELVEPGYDYYGQREAYPPNYYNPIQKQTVKIITSDPTLLQVLRGMDPQKLQDLLNKQIFPYLVDYNIPADTVFDVQVGEARTSPALPIIRPPVITNIRPSTFVYPGPLGPTAVKIGGIGTLKQSELGREVESNEVGGPQTRSVHGCNDVSCSGNDVPSRSSLKSFAQIANLHQINTRDNDYKQGGRNDRNLQNTDDQGAKELTDQIVNAVQSELLYLLRDMNKNSSNPQNSNSSIDTTELRKILQKYTPAAQYFSEMMGPNNQSNSSSRPIDPSVNNYNNNGWNQRSGELNSGNYNSWYINPYSYPNNIGRNANTGLNYSPMNNGQFGNPNYNYQPTNNKPSVNPNYNNQPMNNNPSGYPNYNNQPMNNKPPGNPNYNYQPMNNNPSGYPNYNNQPINNKPSGNPNYNNQPMYNNGQLSNPDNNYSNPNNNYPPFNVNGQTGNSNYNFPPMNNTGRPENANYSISSMNNNQHPGNSTNNLRPLNNSGQHTNPNYNAPPMNSQIPGVLNPNLQPSMNSRRPDFTNQYAQNNPKSEINSPPYNNYGTSGYPINGGYPGYAVPQPLNPTANYFQGQLPYNANISPVYPNQVPAAGYYQSSPQFYNPYNPYQLYPRIA